MPNAAETELPTSVAIGLLIESNKEVKDAVADSAKQSAIQSKENTQQNKETNATLQKLLQFQVQTEERRSSDEDWKKRVEKHQDIQDAKIDKAQTTANEAKVQSLNNGKWINAAVAFLTAIVLYVGKQVVDKLMG